MKSAEWKLTARLLRVINLREKVEREEMVAGSDLNRRPSAGPMKSADRKMTARLLQLINFGELSREGGNGCGGRI